MFLKKKSNIIFRNYDSFAYITDNRNFGYKKISGNISDVGERILSKSGAVFFSVLEKKPQCIDYLVGKIKIEFIDVDFNTLKYDALEFYSILERDGFIVVGETIQECEEKDIIFSYRDSLHQVTKSFSPTNCSLPEKSTREFLDEYFGGEPLLTAVHIEITSKCNERCIHCYIPHENKKSGMDPDLFYSILEECNEMNVLHLTLSGGEPMLHKNFCDFLKKCREYEFSVNILSNLTLLDDEILVEMKKNPLLGVQVSLYSMNPDIHDEITKKVGSFEKTKNAILRLIKNDIPLQISCPVMKKNRDCYNEVIKWAASHNIHAGDDYVIIGSYNNSTDNLNCRLSGDEVMEIIREKKGSDRGHIKKIKMEAENKKTAASDDFICSVCSSSICISDNGDVYPCAGWQSYIVGNIEDKSLSDIWKNSERISYLRELRRYDFPKCIHCVDKDFCTMCMVRNSNESQVGDPLAVNEYFCNIAGFYKEIILENEE